MAKIMHLIKANERDSPPQLRFALISFRTARGTRCPFVHKLSCFSLVPPRKKHQVSHAIRKEPNIKRISAACVFCYLGI